MRDLKALQPHLKYQKTMNMQHIQLYVILFAKARVTHQTSPEINIMLMKENNTLFSLAHLRLITSVHVY